MDPNNLHPHHQQHHNPYAGIHNADPNSIKLDHHDHRLQYPHNAGSPQFGGATMIATSKPNPNGDANGGPHNHRAAYYYGHPHQSPPPPTNQYYYAPAPGPTPALLVPQQQPRHQQHIMQQQPGGEYNLYGSPTTAAGRTIANHTNHHPHNPHRQQQQHHSHHNAMDPNNLMASAVADAVQGADVPTPEETNMAAMAALQAEASFVSHHQLQQQRHHHPGGGAPHFVSHGQQPQQQQPASHGRVVLPHDHGMKRHHEEDHDSDDYMDEDHPSAANTTNHHNHANHNHANQNHNPSAATTRKDNNEQQPQDEEQPPPIKRKRSGHRISWEERIQQLQEYKEEHGDLLIPIRFKENPSLGKFVHNTREQYKLFSQQHEEGHENDNDSHHKNNGKTNTKKCSLTEERVQQLEELGFVWSTERSKHQKEDWEARLQQLKEYKAQHGGKHHDIYFV